MYLPAVARRPPKTYALLHRPPNIPGPGGWSTVDEAGSVAAAREAAAYPPVRLRHGDLLRVVSSTGADHGLWVFDASSGAAVSPPRSSSRSSGKRSWVDWWEGDDARHMAVSWAWKVWGTGVSAPEIAPHPGLVPWSARRTVASCAACYRVARPLFGGWSEFADAADAVAEHVEAWSTGRGPDVRAFRGDLADLRRSILAVEYDTSNPGLMLGYSALQAASGHPYGAVDALIRLAKAVGAPGADAAFAAAMRSSFTLSQILCACLGLADPIGGPAAAPPHERYPR